MWETTPHHIVMPRPKSGTASRAHKASGQGVSLKSLAEHLGLSQAAVSLVINRSPGAKSIPHRTQELIRKAARELNYRPNHLARTRPYAGNRFETQRKKWVCGSTSVL